MNHVHPFGLDPQWHNARNSLVFQNSMKMKVSVILGKRAQKSLPSFLLYIYFQGKQNSHKKFFVSTFILLIHFFLGITQMIFGVFLKTSNAIYFRKPLDFFFECIPMIIFAFSLFGYMVFLIFYKWSIDWNNGTNGMFGPVGKYLNARRRSSVVVIIVRVIFMSAFFFY